MSGLAIDRSPSALRVAWVALVVTFLLAPTFGFAAGSTSEDDCGTGGDAGDSYATASPIPSVTNPCWGRVTERDTQDWFTVTVPAGEPLRIYLLPNPGDFIDVCIYAPSDSTTAVACSQRSFAKIERIHHIPTESGDWRVQVFRDTWAGGYRLYVNPPNSVQDDCGGSGDAPDDGLDSSPPRAITAPVTCTGGIHLDDAEDWFGFHANQGDTIDLALTYGDGNQFDLCLYSPSGSAVTCSWVSGGDEAIERFQTTATGTWLIQVNPFYGVGNYTLTVLPPNTSLPQNDCGSGGDANNSWHSPSRIALPVDCQGDLPRADYVDVFEATVYRGQRLQVEVVPTTGSIGVCTQDPAPPEWEGGFCSTGALDVLATAAGEWPIAIGTSDLRASYNLTARVVDGPQDDCGTPGDAGDTLASARPVLMNGESCMAQLRPNDTGDWYSVEVPPLHRIGASADGMRDLDAEICIYAPALPLVPISCSINTPFGPIPMYAHSGQGGTWLLKVRALSGAGDYQLTIRADAP